MTPLPLLQSLKRAFIKHQAIALITIQSVLLAILVAWFIDQNTPVALPASPIDKLQCVSYAPYYKKGQTPFDPQMMISEAQIEHDLALLADRFHCVRTYSVNQGLDYVPIAAAKLGMQVMLGAWIGWTETDNLAELNKAIDLANAHPSTIKALIIGNEVLLRGEQTEATLKRYLNTAKVATQTPVTYADVWEFWRKHPTLEAEVDFITAHILPYWEDDPQSIDVAIQHTTDVMQLMTTQFKKPIFIGETGWPSEGRQRNSAKPSHLNQAQYIRSFLMIAHEKAWQYNLIEAIDQPWKRALEGTVGGYWGIYDTNLMPKFSLMSPISERNDGIQTLIISALGMLIFIVLGFWLKLKSWRQLIYMSQLGLLTGLTAVIQIEYLSTASRAFSEWLYLGGLVVLSGLMLLAIAVLGFKTCRNSQLFLSFAFVFLAITVLLTNLTLVFDGRYINHPIAIYALICVQLFIANGVKQQLLIQFNLSDWVKQCLLWSLGLSGMACLYQEFSNPNAYLWLGINCLIMLVFWRTQCVKPALALRLH